MCGLFYFSDMNRLPVVTKNLLAINVLMFLALVVMETKGIDLNDILSLHLFVSKEFHVYQIVTYMFMHGDLMHLFFNMFALYMFGRTLEMVWGPKRFLVFYLVAGVGAALVQEAIGMARYYSLLGSMNPLEVNEVVTNGLGILHQGKNYIVPALAELNVVINATTVGASGAIYAILLGFGMLFPNERLFVFPIPFPIKAKFFVIGYALIELYLGTSGAADGVAHFAHLGGMVFGLVMILYWRKQKKIGGPYVW